MVFFKHFSMRYKNIQENWKSARLEFLKRHIKFHLFERSVKHGHHVLFVWNLSIKRRFWLIQCSHVQWSRQRSFGPTTRHSCLGVIFVRLNLPALLGWVDFFGVWRTSKGEYRQDNVFFCTCSTWVTIRAGPPLRNDILARWEVSKMDSRNPLVVRALFRSPSSKTLDIKVVFLTTLFNQPPSWTSDIKVVFLTTLFRLPSFRTSDMFLATFCI